MGNTYLVHYAKGQTANKHRYVAIKNGRYIYPEDVQRSNELSSNKQKEWEKTTDEAFKNIGNADRYQKRNLYNEHEAKRKESIYKRDQYNKAAGVAERKGDLKTAVEYRKKAKDLDRQAEVSAKTSTYAKYIGNNGPEKAPENKIVRKGMSSLDGANSRREAKNRARQTVSDIHSGKTTKNWGVHRIESGNVPDRFYSLRDENGKLTPSGIPINKGGIREDLYNHTDIYRQSDVDQKELKKKYIKNKFKSSVKKFGEKGKAFLSSIFGKKK